MGTGSNFENYNDPQVVVRVGEEGSTGVAEITDMIFSTRGPSEYQAPCLCLPEKLAVRSLASECRVAQRLVLSSLNGTYMIRPMNRVLQALGIRILCACDTCSSSVLPLIAFVVQPRRQ